jgi:hypothetical protein
MLVVIQLINSHIDAGITSMDSLLDPLDVSHSTVVSQITYDPPPPVSTLVYIFSSDVVFPLFDVVLFEVDYPFNSCVCVFLIGLTNVSVVFFFFGLLKFSFSLSYSVRVRASIFCPTILLILFSTSFLGSLLFVHGVVTLFRSPTVGD